MVSSDVCLSFKTDLIEKIIEFICHNKNNSCCLVGEHCVTVEKVHNVFFSSEM